MSIESLVKLFEDYGWPGVLAALCIIIIYYLIIKKYNKSVTVINKGFTNLTETITNQNTTLIHAITTSNEKTQERLFNLISSSIDNSEAKKKKNHKKSIKKRTEIGEYIDDVLWDLLQETHAQRVVMIEFHNSKENLDGLSFLWYDIQHEKQQRGIQSISAKARNLQATNLRPVVRRVNNEKSHIITLSPSDIENIYNESTVLYSQLKEVNVAHVIYMGVYNTDTNELIGIIAIEFQEGHPYYPDLVDYYQLKEKASLVEHYYNQARKELEEEENAEAAS